MHVIGTAGHVDHGKSTLVEALSGIHPDRLKEEREREMTIDLGFAWFILPDGDEIGIVDVPGHRDFIENMLAGIGGIEAALFVIAADEGVMPQTREHLAILDLLEIQTGVVAITKVDLVPDEEWLDLVEEDIRGVLAGTTLENAPIVRVSARTGEGLDDLAAALSKCLAEQPEQVDSGKPRLPVDRVFTIAGFGTVVTGTLSDGSLRVGDEVEILPAGYKGRVRGLQTHKKKEESSVTGSRTAVNISGLTVDEIKRGDVVAYPGVYQATGRFDARLKLINDVSQPLKHNTEVKLFIGAAEVLARIRLLGTDELHPGQQGWIQIETKEPIVAVRGDRFILRRPSPGETIGGGEVIDPHPKGRQKRFADQTIFRLESLSKGTPGEILYQSLLSLGPTNYKELIQTSNLDQQVVQSALSELVSSGQVILLGEQSQVMIENTSPTPNTMLVCKTTLDMLSSRAVADVAQYHQAFPLKNGMPREELKSRMKISPRVYGMVLQWMVDNGQLVESGPVIQLSDHRIKFTPQQQKQIASLFSQFDAAPYTPPTSKDCQTIVGEDVYYALIDQGALIAVNQEVVFTRGVYDQMVQDVRIILQKQGEITAGEMRDYWNTSRRYVLAFLEHLDRQGITVREGDVRRLRK